jgi:hypothetical protein
MCTLKAKVKENSNFTYGLIQLLTSTLTQSTGFHPPSCKCYLSRAIYNFHSPALHLEITKVIIFSTFLRCRFSVDGIPIRVFKDLESMGVAFPKNQPMNSILQHLECGSVGHKRRPCEDWLEPRTLYCFLQKLQCTSSSFLLRNNFLLFNKPQAMAVRKPWSHSNTKAEMGAEELHDLQLLYWHKALPSGISSWVQGQHFLSEIKSLSYYCRPYL